MGMLKRFAGSSLFLPVVALLVLPVFNTIFVDGFLSIQLTEDGRLYGRLVDILNRSCSLIILALGMTFVIATSGIDISVGAVVAISAAVICTMIGGRGDGVAQMPMALAVLAAVGVGVLCGMWNGLLVAKFKIQAVVATLILMTAGRGVAQLMTEGQIITVYYKPFEYIAGFLPGMPLPTNIFIALAMVLLVAVLIESSLIRAADANNADGGGYSTNASLRIKISFRKTYWRSVGTVPGGGEALLRIGKRKIAN